jgi:hypothetical protein
MTLTHRTKTGKTRCGAWKVRNRLGEKKFISADDGSNFIGAFVAGKLRGQQGES